ncbi:MAG: hypothetical protein AAGH81_18100, partial [Bacteroidota bacterium]
SLLVSSFSSCDGNDANETIDVIEPIQVDSTKASFVIEGTPWRFDRFEFSEVAEPNGSMLSATELTNLITEDFSDVIIEFKENGTGTEVRFDPIPSSFFWELNSLGDIVFLDQVGNEFSPLGMFHVNVDQEEISFSMEFPFLMVDEGVTVEVSGTTFLKSEL